MSKFCQTIHTERLVLKFVEPAEADQLSKLVEANLGHLENWMTWASQEQHEAANYDSLTTSWAKQAALGTDFHYGIRLTGDSGNIIGIIGVHHRVGPRAVEIGYWIGEEFQGKGYMSEAVGWLTEVCLAQEGIDSVVIKHEAHNLRSRSIPNRLGFNELGPTKCSDGRQGIQWIATQGKWRYEPWAELLHDK